MSFNSMRMLLSSSIVCDGGAGWGRGGAGVDFKYRREASISMM